MALNPDITQAVIFAGGRGERLKPLTDHMPKPMAPVLGRPFLDYLISTLIDIKIKKILILVGYKAQTIMSRYKDGLSNGIKIEYSVGTEEDLTGRRLLDAYARLDDSFLLMYGDNYWPIEINAMTAHFKAVNLPAMTTVYSNKNGSAEYGFDNNTLVNKGIVSCYDKKRQTPGLNGVDIGYFMLKKTILNPAISGNISFEESILSALAVEQRLAAYVTDRQYYYITNFNTLKDFENAVGRNDFKPLDERLLP